jgi:hypothetical protein
VVAGKDLLSKIMASGGKTSSRLKTYLTTSFTELIYHVATEASREGDTNNSNRELNNRKI